MTELTIYGRGGQGGVTLAKLIATAFFRRGSYVQSFGVYAAERSGAPLQAYLRIDDQEITNYNQIHEPDHVIVLDRTLIGPRAAAGLKENGWLVLNTAEPPESFSKAFAGRCVATVDATAIALRRGLGTRAVPIVNTTILGAVGHVLGLATAEMEAALAELKFGGANVEAVREAFEAVRSAHLAGTPSPMSASATPTAAVGLFDSQMGEPPRIRTGTWATQKPHRRNLTPPCNHGCPAGNDVQGFVGALAMGQNDEALEILLETTPLPGVCGRVCHAPCMDACNRRLFDECVNVRELERHAADTGKWPKQNIKRRNEEIAVVGSGPAGLSAAYHLGKLGYRVKLVEAAGELGGVLRTGIPPYRLPREVLDREIEYVLRHGVSAELGVQIDRNGLLELSRKYAAVFVATGLQTFAAMNLGRSRPDAVIQGLDFLDLTRCGEMSLEDEHVVVIGGGNTAVDAARSAKRVGASKVRILYRRTRAEMPAIREEIDEALDEGVALDELVMPLRLNQNATGCVLTCTRMRLGEPDASGRASPVPELSEDAYFDVHCDRVILALGQSANLSILPEGGEIHQDGRLLGLNDAPIFAGGDFATQEGNVAAAIGNGRKAAWHIHLTLTGEDLFPHDEPPVATPEVIAMHVFEHQPMREGAMVAPRVRRRSFVEVRRGLCSEADGEVARAEAQRCFSCGVCNQCDRCVTYCPEGVVRRDGDGYCFDYDYCKGCGLCAEQCPRGVVYLSEL